MNKKKMFDLSTNGSEQIKDNDVANNVVNNVANNDEVYVMPIEDFCSAEFSEGCKIMDDQGE